MEAAIQDNRRQAYRYAPPLVMEPIFTLIRDGERTRAQSVVDINVRGARVCFPNAAAPKIHPGDEVVASVQAPGLDGCVDFPARVVFSAEQDAQRLIALMFRQVPDIDDRVDANFFSVFNRRQDERPDSGIRVNAVVHATADADNEPTGFEIRVVNHTSKGIAFVVNKALDRLIEKRDTVDLSIQTAEQTEPQRVSARVLHRAVRAEAIYYGCMFNHA